MHRDTPVANVGHSGPLANLQIDTKFWRVINAPDGGAVIQRDLGMLERNLTKFSKGKWQVLHPGRNIPGICSGLIKCNASLQKKALGVLIQTRMTISKQYTTNAGISPEREWNPSLLICLLYINFVCIFVHFVCILCKGKAWIPSTTFVFVRQWKIRLGRIYIFFLFPSFLCILLNTLFYDKLETSIWLSQWPW